MKAWSQSSCYRLTGEQLEIPSPPKKNSSPYATIAVCLQGKHKIMTGVKSGEKRLNDNWLNYHSDDNLSGKMQPGCTHYHTTLIRLHCKISWIFSNYLRQNSAKYIKINEWTNSKLQTELDTLPAAVFSSVLCFLKRDFSCLMFSDLGPEMGHWPTPAGCTHIVRRSDF